MNCHGLGLNDKLSTGIIFNAAEAEIPVPASGAKKNTEKCVKSYDLIRLIGEISKITKRKVRLNEQ